MTSRIKQSQQGMALIEVLVGMAIMAIVLLSAMRAISNDTETQQAVMTRSLALVSANNTMTALYISSHWPALGVENIPCPQLNYAFVCEQKILNSTNPNFRRVDISVYLDDGSDPERRTKLAWLSGLIANAENAL